MGNKAAVQKEDGQEPIDENSHVSMNMWGLTPEFVETLEKGFKEFFAVKATPNPFLIDILREYGCGCDCSSLTELMLSHAMGVKGGDIMFSSNDTPAEEFAYANEIGATINLDDITHIDFLEKTPLKEQISTDRFHGMQAVIRKIQDYSTSLTQM